MSSDSSIVSDVQLNEYEELEKRLNKKIMKMSVCMFLLCIVVCAAMSVVTYLCARIFAINSTTHYLYELSTATTMINNRITRNGELYTAMFLISLAGSGVTYLLACVFKPKLTLRDLPRVYFNKK